MISSCPVLCRQGPYLFLVLLSFFVLPQVLSGAEGDPGPSQMELLDDEWLLDVGDRLVYQVIEEKEAPVTLFVDDEGEVDVPLIGRVEAKDKSCRALALEVKDLLEVDFFYRATVLIRRQGDGQSRGNVTLVGEVNRQGTYPVPADHILTVSNLILQSGGLRPGADATQVKLVRPSGDGSDATIIDVDHMLEEGDFRQDEPVRAGDLVVVPQLEALQGQYIVDGAVNSPGLYKLPVEKNFTVSKAILRAGGFSRFANERKVRLIRADRELPADERVLLVDVKKVLEEGDLESDPLVMPDDIIRVEEKLFNF